LLAPGAAASNRTSPSRYATSFRSPRSRHDARPPACSDRAVALGPPKAPQRPVSHVLGDCTRETEEARRGLKRSPPVAHGNVRSTPTEYRV
jgi:hypothetical protein